MSDGHLVEYTEEYKEICFQSWYRAGRPSGYNQIREAIPKDKYGRKPVKSMIDAWRQNLMWDFRADDLDAKALAIVDNDLVMQKVEMLRRQATNAKKWQDKSLEFLEKEGFDSSASAVNAYFRGSEEERLTRGIGDMIVKMSKMSDADLKDEIIKRLQRAAENNQIIDTEAVDVSRSDTESTEDIDPNTK